MCRTMSLRMPKKPTRPRRKKAAAASLGLAATEAAQVEVGALDTLTSTVTSDGGAVLARFRDPVGGKPLVLASLPLDRVEPTPLPAGRRVRRARQAPHECRREDLPVPRPDHRRPSRPTVLDAERQSSTAGAEEARLPRDHGARRTGRRGRLQDPRAQHREGAQPAREVARDDSDGARAGRPVRLGGRVELRLRVRAAGVSHAGHLLRVEAPALGRRVSVDPATRGRVPGLANDEGAR